MSIYTKVNGEQKEVSDCKVKVGGVWKKAVLVYAKVNGIWKKVRRSSTIIVVTKTGNSAAFTIPISGYSGTSVQNAEIRNLYLRLHRKTTGELLGESYLPVVKVTSGSSPILSVVWNGTDWSASFTIHLTSPKLTVYPTLSPSTSVYAELEFDEVVKV